MNRIVLLALVLLTACTSTERPLTQGCDGYEKGRLKGLHIGAQLSPPDPTTAEGKTVIEEIEFLTLKCEG